MANNEITSSKNRQLLEEVQQNIIECLNRFYAIETGMWGDPIDALIIRTIIVGEIQNKPFDLSALKNFLGLPIGTLHRKIKRIEKDGFITIDRSGRSAYLHPTDKTRVEIDRSFEEMINTIRTLYIKTPGNPPIFSGALNENSGSCF